MKPFVTRSPLLPSLARLKPTPTSSWFRELVRSHWRPADWLREYQVGRLRDSGARRRPLSTVVGARWDRAALVPHAGERDGDGVAGQKLGELARVVQGSASRDAAAPAVRPAQR